MYIDLIILVLSFLLAFGFSGMVMKRNGMSYVNSYKIYFAYWGIFSFFLYSIYWDLLVFLRDLNLGLVMMYLLVLFSSIAIIYSVFRAKLKAPKDMIEKYGKADAEFLFMNLPYVIVKTVEIAFQQLFVTILVLLLHQNLGMNFLELTLYFLVFFGVVHFLLLFFMDIKFVLLYSIAAMLASFIFPFMILNIQYGLVYNYIIHWMFYLISGMLVWLYYNFVTLRNEN